MEYWGKERMDREGCKKKLTKKKIHLKQTLLILALIFKPGLISLILLHAMLKASTLLIPIIRRWIKVFFFLFFFPFQVICFWLLMCLLKVIHISHFSSCSVCVYVFLQMAT